MNSEGKDTAKEWVGALCHHAGEDGMFCKELWAALQNSEPVFKEFAHYLQNRDFLCEYRISGYTIIDIMVWQMDHFKARLDSGDHDMVQNKDKMLLMAFDTMLKMEKQPEKYVHSMQSETGTDYPDKY